MRIKKWVMEIVGKQIEKYGFFYEEDRSDNAAWFFKKKGEPQGIMVQKHRFCKQLMLRFRHPAARPPELDAVNFVPPEQYQNHITEDVRKEFVAWGHDLHSQPMWFYDNEEDVRGILEEFVEVIEKYGLAKLEELDAIEACRIIPTKEMYEKLFHFHDDLGQKFIDEFGIFIEHRSEDEIRAWFQVISRKMQELKEEPYENVQDFLVNVAAFLGNQSVVILDGIWKEWTFGSYMVSVEDLKCHMLSRYDSLDDVVEAWNCQRFAPLEEEFVWMSKAKLPLTEEQMIRLTDEFQKLPQQ